MERDHVAIKGSVRSSGDSSPDSAPSSNDDGTSASVFAPSSSRADEGWRRQRGQPKTVEAGAGLAA